MKGKLQTKFSVGDKVWIMYYNVPNLISITNITVSIDSSKKVKVMNRGCIDSSVKSVDNISNQTFEVNEDLCFSTKSKLLNSLR